jgi:hypothetical protein
LFTVEIFNSAGVKMPELKNSKRNILQATYSPISPAKPVGVRRCATFKSHFIAYLKPTFGELAKLKSLNPKAAKTIEILEACVRKNIKANALNCASLLRDVKLSELGAIARNLVQLRKEEVASLLEYGKKLQEQYFKSEFECKSAALIPGEGWKEDKETAVPELPHAKVYTCEQITAASGGAKPALKLNTEGKKKVKNGMDNSTYSLSAKLVELAKEKDESASAAAPTLKLLCDWAVKEDPSYSLSVGFLELLKERNLNPEILTFRQVFSALESVNRNMDAALDDFDESGHMEPVGFLHLEKLSFIPAGIEQGELVYSVPLAPAEEVNIAHKEWSNTSEEFSQIVTDYMEDYSEEGVAEKSELAQASNSQQQYSSALNVGVSVSGGYGPVNMSTSLTYNLSRSASRSEQSSRNQSMSLTRKASARTKKEHKTSFKVASASGTVDSTVRKIRNPFPDRAVRVDYYQLMRKWQVNLYRYGIRMTYDIVVPEPGGGLMAKINELKSLRETLAQGFGPDAQISWAKFDLAPQNITRDNYLELCAKYCASVETPLDDYIRFTKTNVQREGLGGDSAKLTSFEVEIPDGYYVTEVEFKRKGLVYNDSDYEWEVYASPGKWIGKSGILTVTVGTTRVDVFALDVRIVAKLKDSLFKEWQLKAWAAMRDAAQARYNVQQQALKDRIAQLSQEIGDRDALSLRKMEREEMMRCVLKWLLGPESEMIPENIHNFPIPFNDEADYWLEMTARGEWIKFLHQAIEWENMIYFLYPYFWSGSASWNDKKYIEHPDATHKAFLKSGCARVVLTIRPGFEEAFASLMDSGGLGGLGGDHPYMTIAEEMRNYAETNYPGIPPANPDGADAAEAGQLIGTWYEYTPTSALDIKFAEVLPDA